MLNEDEDYFCMFEGEGRGPPPEGEGREPPPPEVEAKCDPSGPGVSGSDHPRPILSPHLTGRLGRGDIWQAESPGLGTSQSKLQLSLAELAESLAADVTTPVCGKIESELVEEKKTTGLQSFVASIAFSVIIGVVVVINVGVVVYTVDFGETFEAAVVTHACTLIFICEMCLKIVAYGILAYAKDWWNLFDVALIAVGLIDAFVWARTHLVAMAHNIEVEGNPMNTLRLLRVLRVSRSVKLLRQLRQLWIVVVGMVLSVQTIVWISMLLSLAVIIFATPITLLVGQDESGKYAYDSSAIVVMEESHDWNNFKYFGTLGRSCYTLMQMAIGAEGDEYGRALFEEDPWVLLLFLFFMLTTNFGIMNVIIGAIVDNMAHAAEETDKTLDEAELERRRKLVDQLAQAVKEIDAQGVGRIDLKSVEAAGAHASPLTRELLAQLGDGSAAELLRFLDFDGSGDVSYTEFMEGLYSLLSGDDTKHFYLLQTGHNSTKRMMRLSAAESQRRHNAKDEDIRIMKKRLVGQERVLESIRSQVSDLAHKQGWLVQMVEEMHRRVSTI